jgi:excalibur calcium-binding domain-containing protein
MRSRAIAATAILALVGAVFAGSPANAATTTFKNCTAMHKVYKYGVAKSSYAATHAKPANIRPPKVSSSLYTKNSKMDRDKDGVACEVSR